jgi:F-type H+-transporting ATPase subunit b
MLPWEWANFLVLAGGLGYLIAKNAGGFFRARTASIQKDITESARLREEAEAKAREIEERVAALGADIEKLRADSIALFSVEGERIRQETEQHLARLRQQTEREIDSMSKAAREGLHAYAANLALDLAEERIRSRMDPPAQSRLLDAFTHQLGATRPEARQ